MTERRRQAPAVNAPAPFIADDLETAWQDDALCNKIGDPENWFPTTAEWNQGRGDDAIAICQQCPVRLKCLDYAMKCEVTHTGQPNSFTYRYGIYGGKTPMQRAELAKGAA